ncbi:MAG: hypothetical protein JWN17_673 [Frankiales bacterium]|nr:hypothetical protein [Frankiales bacterium]
MQHAVQPGHQQQPSDGRGDVLQHEDPPGTPGPAVRPHEDPEAGRVDRGQAGQVQDELPGGGVDLPGEGQPDVGRGDDVEPPGQGQEASRDDDVELQDVHAGLHTGTDAGKSRPVASLSATGAPEQRGGAPRGRLRTSTAAEGLTLIVSSYHYLLGPIVAVAALGVIVLLCRWVFSTDHRADRADARLQKVAGAHDYGLLVPVATVRAAEDAELLRSVLKDAGIRGTIAAAADGGLSVLVFRGDASRAKGLVSS